MVLYRVLAGAGLFMSLFTASRCGGAGQSGRPPEVSKEGMPRQSDDTLYHLDLTNPSIEQALGPDGAGKETFKFVRIEVVQVTNPARHPLTFEVRHRSKDGAISTLGNFSLYPADNPGKFIVPTQGKLKGGGALILTLATPDKAGSDPIQVAVKRLSLTNG